MRYRSEPVFEVDWRDDGAYDHELSDVTADVDTDFQAALGTSTQSNPERPTIAPLTGRITLVGANYSPGESLLLTGPELRRRHRFRVTWSGTGATELLCTGWLQEPQRQDSRAGKKRTQYKLEGLLEQRLQQNVSLVHTKSNSDTEASQDIVTDFLGAPFESYTYQPTDLTIFSFRGFFGELLSKFGAVAGAFR